VKSSDRLIIVKGPKGQLEYKWPEGVIVKIENNNLVVSIVSEDYKNLW
jgi:ribosomal protein L6P/L9E